MSVLTIATFLGLLALAALLGVLGVLVLLMLDRIGVVRGARGRVQDAVGPMSLWLAALVALVATSGSLWFSEVAGFVPCALCWYQRIAMYPLALILGIAAARNDVGVVRYAVPLAVVGAAISLWHIGVQRIPSLPSGSCSLDVPCSTIDVQVVGFITIPTMALAGFLAIITLLLLASGGRNEPGTESLA